MRKICILLVLVLMTQNSMADGVDTKKIGENIKKGADAFGEGLEKGGKAVGKELKQAGEWTGKQMKKGGEKLEKASK
jgi:hypothetical protein